MTSFTAKQLFEIPEPSPTNWIVEGLLRSGRGRPSLLCGFPESGKSTLSNQLAVAVANGTPFLGRETTQGHVILWKAEDSIEDVAADLRKVGLTAGSDLSIVLPDPEETNLGKLKKELAGFPNTRLVIIETFQDFFEDVKDITSNDDCKDALVEFCKELVAPHPECTFLILHQFNKSKDDADLSIKKVLGGTALAARTDAKIYLRQVSDADPRRVIHATVRKGRGIPQTYLIFEEETLTSRLGDTVKDEKIQKRKIDKLQKELDLDEKIVQVIAENPGLSKWMVVKLVGGRADTTGKRIDTLIEAGFIRVEPGGEKGNAQLLFAPVSDAEHLMSKMQGGEHVNVN